MIMKLLANLWAARAVMVASAQYVRSCGSAGDHFRNVRMEVTPARISRGNPLTITVSGDLDQDLSSLVAAVDLDVRAFRIIDKQLQGSTNVTLSPGILMGFQEVVVGPLVLPNEPGDVVVGGTLRLSTSQGEPILCARLDLDIPAMETIQEPRQDTSSQCTRASDHVRNITVSGGSGEVEQISFDLDEDLDHVTVDVDIQIRAAFIHVPLHVTIPVAYRPGIRSGHWEIAADSLSLSNGMHPVSVAGQISITDTNDQQVTCFAIGSDSLEIVL